MVSTTDVADGWGAYYRANENRLASPLLRRALGEDLLPHGNGYAVDLGCGAGVETALLLRSGWDVLAIDLEPRAIAHVQALDQSGGRLVALCSRFEDLENLPPCSLIHAGLSLPFCSPAGFPKLWALIVSALEPGGFFAGHFFGNRHDWTERPGMSFQAAEDIEILCKGLKIELLREAEGDGGYVPHHWHRFDLIVSKVSS